MWFLCLSCARQRCRVQGSNVEAKGNMKCRQRERAAAELSAELSMPAEDRRVSRKAAMLRLQRRGVMRLWTGSVQGSHDISTLGAWRKRWSASCVSVFRLTDAASGGQSCGTQLLQCIALILRSSDNDAAQLRLVLPSIEVPVISRDVLCSPAICYCSI